MKPKNILMNLPVQILEELQADELGFVVAGSGASITPFPNNSGGTCAGANNSTGTCQGANNSTGSCNETNNSSGSCNETNNKSGLCQTINNGSGICDVIVNPRPDKPIV